MLVVVVVVVVVVALLSIGTIKYNAKRTVNMACASSDSRNASQFPDNVYWKSMEVSVARA